MEQTVVILGRYFLLSYNWLLVVWQDGTAWMEDRKPQGPVVATFPTLCNQAVFPCLPAGMSPMQGIRIIPTFNPFYGTLEGLGSL